MALRFRKTIKLAPGIRMNLSGGGLSWSLGPRGASIGIGKRGTYLNTGLPGTGIYTRQALSSGSARPKAGSIGTKSMSATVSVSDEGVISFRDSAGNPLSDDLVEAAKKQQGEVIKALIQKTCDDVNAQVEALGCLHHYTSDPRVKPLYVPQTFDEPCPQKPVPVQPEFFARLFKSKVAKIEMANEQARRRYELETASWLSNKASFDESEKNKQRLVERVTFGEKDAMESFIAEVLTDIVWPRETDVSFDISAQANEIDFDVDLPEIEDMPTKTAAVPQRGFKLSVKEMAMSPRN